MLLAVDTTAPVKKKKRSFFDDIIEEKNKDSLIYDVRLKQVHIYNQGDLKYQNMQLKADYMRLSMDTKQIYAYGKLDTAGVATRPEFNQGGSNYTMDTITYNMGSGKAKIKGAATQDGEGYLLGRSIKKMSDNTINMAHGKYTTCDNLEHPHFYIEMTKAKVIPGKKVITGPAYFVMEDVPIYFLGVPGGFFPISSGPQSGFIMPTYGEESRRGFFLRDGGYYFTFGDYADLTLLAGIYTLGSWEASARSSYVKRYKYNGTFSANYARTVMGEKGGSDRISSGNFQINWTHQQDPKFRPNSTFAANVNFSTSGYNQYAANNLQDFLNTQTNSSISYSKNWAGTPFSLSTNIQHSQNSRDSTIMISFPNLSFNMTRINPFQRKEAIGKAKWYEKISLSYSMQLSNSVTAKERDLFTKETLMEMRNGVIHKIPVSASWTIFKYLNLSTSFNYTERWYFSRTRQEWDPVELKVVELEKEFGFYRVYNYSTSASFNTKVYGMFQFKGKNPIIKAIRHVMTPSLGLSYTPNFGDLKYGFYENIQSDSTGRVTVYSPYSGGINGVPGRGEQASLTFSLDNNVEMKVRSRTDTSGYKKIKVIDNLRASGSYNFIADSLNLSIIQLNLRTTLYGNLGLNINATWDLYKVNEQGRRINQFNVGHGKFGRIATASTSFGYTFNNKKSDQPAINDINSGAYESAYVNPFNLNYPMDYELRRRMMVTSYYDFNIPWNLGVNYSLSYANTGIKQTVTQTVGFNGSVNLTPKWGITFSGGYDFQTRKLSASAITLTRDLHCWQMSFQWYPIGAFKSWSFNIQVKSSMLSDLKYDKSSSRFDSLGDD